MEKTKYKAKRFLLPILSLVLISIFLIATFNAYLTIDMFKTHMKEHISQSKKEYIEKYKNETKKDVKFVNDSIVFQITKIENRLKKSLKEKVQISLDVTNIIYNTYKNSLPKKEIKQKIAEALATIKFNDNRGYYFMYDNKTKVLFGHPMKKFIGKDMTNFRDIRGQSLMELDAAILEKEKIGFSKIYFNKPNNQNKEFPKITCITKFEPLDIVIGTGEYLDVVEEQTKKYVLQRFEKVKYQKHNKYLFILDLHNLEGGDDFATVLLNSNRPALVGTQVSSNGKDIKGNKFRLDFLNKIKEKGEGYSSYWYKKPSTKLPELKMSFIYFQKDWNWMIGSGFYYDDLEKQIIQMKKTIDEYTNDTINKTLIWVTFLSFISILIAVFVSFKIDKTIEKYTKQIVKIEESKRDQESLLIQQSKMASMGEMMESIAHQWRQPLSVISTSVSGIKLQKELDDLTDKQLLTQCDSIINSTTHLSDTINDFRNFFKKNKLKKDFMIENTFHKSTNLLISLFKNKEIEVIENIDEIVIHGFENELVQVFMNILNNAKDELEKKDMRRMIFVDIHKENNNIIIKIKDNAKGIKEKILSKIFDSHFTTKEEEKGTGIGLYMSKMIIENSFKGSIEAKNVKFFYEDIKYKGAEFTITIPTS